MTSLNNLVIADSFFKRLAGLMFKKDFESVMLFKNLTDSSIHTMFMRFEIDVYFINENNVIYDKKTLKPWKFYRPDLKAKYILEAKSGKLDLEIGDEMDFKFYQEPHLDE